MLCKGLKAAMWVSSPRLCSAVASEVFSSLVGDCWHTAELPSHWRVLPPVTDVLMEDSPPFFNLWLLHFCLFLRQVNIPKSWKRGWEHVLRAVVDVVDLKLLLTVTHFSFGALSIVVGSMVLPRVFLFVASTFLCFTFIVKEEIIGVPLSLLFCER